MSDVPPRKGTATPPIGAVGQSRPVGEAVPARKQRTLDSVAAEKIDLDILDDRPLKNLVTVEVLTLFKLSLLGTLVAGGCLVLVDAVFVLFKVIQPDQRLVSERIIMTFVTATVVQVGTAFGAIVFAVFKASGNTPRPTE